MIGIMEKYQKELLNIAAFTPKTVNDYIYRVKTYCEYAKVRLNIDPFNSKRIHLENWIYYLKVHKNASPSVLHHYRASLLSFFAFLSKINLIKENPAGSLPKLRKKISELNKPISTEKVYAILRTIDQSTWKGQRNFIMVSFMWALGLRVSETASLRVGDFDPYHVPKQKIGLLRINGKGQRQRALFVVDKLYDNLMDYLRNPQTPRLKEEPLFPNHKNEPVSARTVHSITQDYARKTGIKERVSPHVLRHCFATEMYHQKVPLQAIMAMMGHEDIRKTSIYVHVKDELNKIALELLSINYKEALWE